MIKLKAAINLTCKQYQLHNPNYSLLTMSLRTYLFLIFIATVLCWGALLLTIFNTNPQEAGNVALFSFFGSLFFTSIGTLTLVGFYLRVFFSKNEIIYANMGVSFRQAVLLSICLTGLLGLQALRLLNWWDGILFCTAVLSLELYFRSK